jgi:hypothetical protein
VYNGHDSDVLAGETKIKSKKSYDFSQHPCSRGNFRLLRKGARVYPGNANQRDCVNIFIGRCVNGPYPGRTQAQIGSAFQALLVHLPRGPHGTEPHKTDGA